MQFLHVCLILAPQLPKAHLPETVYVDWNLHAVPEEINSADKTMLLKTESERLKRRSWWNRQIGKPLACDQCQLLFPSLAQTKNPSQPTFSFSSELLDRIQSLQRRATLPLQRGYHVAKKKYHLRVFDIWGIIMDGVMAGHSVECQSVF